MTKRSKPGSAAYVAELASGLQKTLDLWRKAESGNARALAALRRRLEKPS
jgi:hypothetical protein